MKNFLSSLWQAFYSLRALLILGALEFAVSAVLTLNSAPDPKNAFLFGYSLPRLAIFLLAFISGIVLLIFAIWPMYAAHFVKVVERLTQKRPMFLAFLTILSALIALIVYILPQEMVGSYSLYFERVRPVLFVVFSVPVQIYFFLFKKFDWNLDRSSLRLGFLFLGLLLAVGTLILVTGWGITPEQDHWDVAGIPLTGLQLACIVVTAVLVFGLWGGIREKGVVSNRVIDFLIILALYIGTCLIWFNTPLHRTDFNTQSSAPYFQSYPLSDASTHDLGSLSILKGYGIFFRNYTDKPLYMVFLSLLHLLGGYNYNLLAILHMSFLALMAPVLYIFGKTFHSRFFGFILAGMVIIRQQNAISLTSFLNFVANSRQFLTEVPTLLGLIVFSWVLFTWVKTQNRPYWAAFITGAVLGALCLVRLNPFLLILAMPVFLFLARGRKMGSTWMRQLAIFLLGCFIFITPWILTGRNPLGQPYFLIKFYDIINVRYGPRGVLPSINPPISAIQSSVGLLSGTGSINPIFAGLAIPGIDIHKFPGFVLNHTMHNFVGSFLTLPDSWRWEDQKLAVLMDRPYWRDGREQLQLSQVPFLFLNLVLLAVGMAWSWKRWKWGGMVPIYIFAVYALSLGFARTSGSRYLTPMDWVVDFYFGLGLLTIFQILPKGLLHFMEVEPGGEKASRQGTFFLSLGMRYVFTLAIVAMALLVPAVQTIVPEQDIFCKPVTIDDSLALQLNSGSQLKYNWLYGEVLYPEIEKGTFKFDLFTCRNSMTLSAADFKGKLQAGQPVIAGFSSIGSIIQLEVLILPAAQEQPAKILWQAGGK